jgi:hypothetical protein
VKPKGTFEVMLGGNKAFLQPEPFIYANRFSAEATWGDDISPREGDSIIIPKEETLVIDVNPPFIDTIIVLGKLIFDDTLDLELKVKHLLIRDGEFAVGSELNPRKRKMTITLSGRYNDRQLPEFGNKVIGCHECRLDIHGERRLKTWTDLAATAERGATSITLLENTDWRVGEEIVITSTGWNHLESERRFIQTISTDGKTITFAEPLQYRHYSAIETYGTKQFPMRAEVGMLTRNILI